MNKRKPTNLKLLKMNEIFYLLNKYTFKVEDDYIKVVFNNRKDSYMIFDLVNEYNSNYLLVFTHNNRPTKRAVLKIDERSVRICIDKKGKWNLVVIQQMISTLVMNNIDPLLLTDSELTIEYNKIINEYFVSTGIYI